MPGRNLSRQCLQSNVHVRPTFDSGYLHHSFIFNIFYEMCFNWCENVHTQINQNGSLINHIMLCETFLENEQNQNKWFQFVGMWQQYIATMFLNKKIIICQESHWHWIICRFKEPNWHWIIVQIVKILNLHELATFCLGIFVNILERYLFLFLLLHIFGLPWSEFW